MTTETLHLDVETRSPRPFGAGNKAVTAHQYANDPNTQLLVVRYAFGDGEIRGWRPILGEEPPEDLVEAVRAGVTMAAHNAGFEWAIWNFVVRRDWDVPPLAFDNMDCTAARSAVMALPRSLAQAAPAMEIPVRKDLEGSKVMKKMAKPRATRRREDFSEEDWESLVLKTQDFPLTHTQDKTDPDVIYTWWFDEELFATLDSYCADDVAVERALDHALVPLSKRNRTVWLLDHDCNTRGVLLDVELARKAYAVMELANAEYRRRIARVTGGAVTAPTQVAKLLQWIEERGVRAVSLDKAGVRDLLEQTDDPEVIEALNIRREAGKSSVAKLSRFLVLTGDDNRMRENFLFHGAATGRFTGKGAQLQNLPSRTGLGWRDAESVVQIILEEETEAALDMIEAIYGDAPSCVSSCLRAHIKAAEGKELHVADFSNIEGRVAAWFGQETAKLDAFRAYDRGEGPDLYKVTAGMIIGISPYKVDKSQRNVLGKVPELALGFQGGAGAFDGMAQNYGIDMADYLDTVRGTLDAKFVLRAEENWDTFGKKNARSSQETWLASEMIKLAWRDRHPGIVQCWADAEAAAIHALQCPGEWFTFAGGRCALGAQSIAGVMFLVGRLPSGRRIYKAHAHLRSVEKFGREALQIYYTGVDSITRKWRVTSTYGGDLYQSFVQGTAYDLMMNGWYNVQKNGFDVVLSVHDELGAEAPIGRDNEEFCRLMSQTPSWAEGCPVVAEGYVAKRYRKD